MARLDLITQQTHIQKPQETSKAGITEIRTRPGSASPVLSSVDSASVSSTASVVAQGVAQSDVRLDKVTALQQAIAGGTYNISAGAVADKIIGSLLGGSAFGAS